MTDPAVGWYNELDEITPADGDTDEVVVIPTKTAGLTLLSNELADDSDPAIANQAAAGLANQIATAIDTAYLGNTTAKGPSGLLSLTTQVVDPGTSVANLDPFIDARFAAEAHNASLSVWLMHPDTAKALTKLKVLSSGTTNRCCSSSRTGSRLPACRFSRRPTLTREPLLGGSTRHRFGMWAA